MEVKDFCKIFKRFWIRVTFGVRLSRSRPPGVRLEVDLE